MSPMAGCGNVMSCHVDHLKESVSTHDLPASDSDFDMDIPFTSTPDHTTREEPEDSPSNDNSGRSESGGNVNLTSTSGTASSTLLVQVRSLLLFPRRLLVGIRLANASHLHD